MDILEQCKSRIDGRSKNLLIICENTRQIDFIKKEISAIEEEKTYSFDKNSLILVSKNQTDKCLLGRRYRQCISGYEYEKRLDKLRKSKGELKE